MTPQTKSPSPFRRILRTGLMAAGVTAVLGGATLAPALADPGGWHQERFARERDGRDHDWRGHERFAYRPYAYVAPSYGYAYGYGYAPPAYAAPSLNFVFPIR